MLKALFLLTVAAGEKAAAEPTRRVAIASFMVVDYNQTSTKNVISKVSTTAGCCRHRVPTWRSGLISTARTNVSGHRLRLRAYAAYAYFSTNHPPLRQNKLVKLDFKRERLGRGPNAARRDSQKLASFSRRHRARESTIKESACQLQV